MLLFAPAAGDSRLAAQREAFAAERAGLAERDLDVIEVAGDRVAGATDPAATLRRRFGVAAGGFALVLVGKDGDIAERSAAPVAAARLFARIDAMPMRRREMRR